MATVIRVKRKRGKNPAHALVVSCKRKKVESTAVAESAKPEPQTDVFKFAGTIEKAEKHIVAHIQHAIGLEELKQKYKRWHFDDAIKKVEHGILSKRSQNRYKLTSLHRDISEDNDFEQDIQTKSKSGTDSDSYGASNAQDDEADLFCMYDALDSDASESDTDQVPKNAAAEKKPMTCNGVEMTREAVSKPLQNIQDDFVYDLYYANAPYLNLLEGPVNIVPFTEEEFIHDSIENDTREGEYYDDEDDSNDESNWRNEYPDEDPDFENQEDLCFEDDPFDRLDRMMHEWRIGDEEEASSVDNDDNHDDNYSHQRAYQCLHNNENQSHNEACDPHNDKPIGGDGEEDLRFL